VRVKRAALFVLPALLVASNLRAEYVVLRSGQRLVVTSYQLIGDKYRLQMKGGTVEIPAEEVVTIEPEDVFTAVPAQPAVKPPYRELVEAAAARYKVDADLITSVIAAESNFDPKAVSPKNARGLMQLLPETAAMLGVLDIYDPKENIDAGTHYLADLLQQYNGDLNLALAAYNAGPDKVQKYGRVPPISETISYVRRVKKNYDKSKKMAAAKTIPPGVAQVKSSSPLNTSAVP
jgi:soluble lytic murein transglycosylase-like protein